MAFRKMAFQTITLERAVQLAESYEKPPEKKEDPLAVKIALACIPLIFSSLFFVLGNFHTMNVIAGNTVGGTLVVLSAAMIAVFIKKAKEEKPLKLTVDMQRNLQKLVGYNQCIAINVQGTNYLITQNYMGPALPNIAFGYSFLSEEQIKKLTKQ